MEKEKTALPGPRSSGPCQVTPAELQTQLQQHPRWKQEEAEARTGRWQLTQPHAGDQEQNSTEKVERLRDNQRGLSVVIYNRDCKMVN